MASIRKQTACLVIKESQEVRPFPVGDHKAHKNRRSQRDSKHQTEKKT